MDDSDSYGSTDSEQERSASNSIDSLEAEGQSVLNRSAISGNGANLVEES